MTTDHASTAIKVRCQSRAEHPTMGPTRCELPAEHARPHLNGTFMWSDSEAFDSGSKEEGTR